MWQIVVASENVQVGYDKGFGTVEVVASLEDFQSWNHENPSLYIAVLELENYSDEKIETVDCESCRIGFREVKIDVQQRQILLNDKALRINGVNRLK